MIFPYAGIPFQGSVAQWIRRLPTEQEIVGSSPAWVKPFVSQNFTCIERIDSLTSPLIHYHESRIFRFWRILVYFDVFDYFGFVFYSLQWHVFLTAFTIEKSRKIWISLKWRDTFWGSFSQSSRSKVACSGHFKNHQYYTLWMAWYHGIPRLTANTVVFG